MKALYDELEKQSESFLNDSLSLISFTHKLKQKGVPGRFDNILMPSDLLKIEECFFGLDLAISRIINHENINLPPSPGQTIDEYIRAINRMEEAFYLPK